MSKDLYVFIANVYSITRARAKSWFMFLSKENQEKIVEMHKENLK